MRNLNIVVGPHKGTYKTCRSPSNDRARGYTKAFECEPNAKGTSLKITMKGRNTALILSEVFIFGTGKVAWNINNAINMRQRLNG